MSEAPAGVPAPPSPKGVQKLTLLYLSLGGLVIGGLLGWTLRANQPPLPPEPAAQTPARPAQPLDAQTPAHSIVFTTDDRPTAATADLLPARATKIYCFYRFPDLPPEPPVSARWWHNGADLGRVEIGEPAEEPRPQETEDAAREADSAAVRDEQVPHIILTPPGGAKSFAPGIYEVELRSGDQPPGRGSFVVATNAKQIMAAKPSEKGQTRIVSCVTARKVNARGEPEEPQKTFSGGEKIYVAFAYINGTAGGGFRVQWYYRDQLIEQASQELAMKGGAGRGFAWLKAEEGRLPAGKHRVVLFLQRAERPLAQARFTVQD